MKADVDVMAEESSTALTERSIFHVSSALVGASLAALVLSVGFVITSLRPGPEQSSDQPKASAAPIPAQRAAPRAELEAEPSSAAAAGAEAEALRRLEGVLMGGVVLLESMAEPMPGQVEPKKQRHAVERPRSAPSVVRRPRPARVRRAMPAALVNVEIDELDPRVQTFVESWLEALRTADHSLYTSLGFREPASEFERAYEARESFRLVDSEIVDIGRRAPMRIYLQVVVSYAFERPDGRFRTEDTHRVILEDGPGGLRVAGSWQ